MRDGDTPQVSGSTELLSTRDLACRRGRRWLFRGLQMALPAGSITWLRGTNGSGKTSLMRILAGLSQPTDGEVLWRGDPISRASQASRRGLLYIGHSNALKEDLSLAEAVGFLATLADLDRPLQRAQAALERLGLASRRDAPVRTLSQGQRRRGALARLVLDEAPRAWLLDEPFDALDQPGVGQLARLIEGHAARGGAVLLTSHQAVDLAGAATLDLEAWRVQ